MYIEYMYCAKFVLGITEESTPSLSKNNINVNGKYTTWQGHINYKSNMLNPLGDPEVYTALEINI